ncbi:hypothetical protein OG884_07315 [Streptosporangium sp. NBC_01755]|uniref:hypothetical protein n=1 Tax=unclassified Streptosporangium TaxID=2632669 RepID=UPI002DDC5C42|nr:MULTISPECIES: hypothetical protein [unclassified Streptosporangium]WSA26849.1 hypothetical protein OIE13_02835 [Streptosporangium sp. NBC_01810]WSD01726.1 hypothetical protein OG884_07315 [Streptosporangium sp. NBC_01755]
MKKRLFREGTGQPRATHGEECSGGDALIGKVAWQDQSIATRSTIQVPRSGAATGVSDEVQVVGTGRAGTDVVTR